MLNNWVKIAQRTIFFENIIFHFNLSRFVGHKSISSAAIKGEFGRSAKTHVGTVYLTRDLDL